VVCNAFEHDELAGTTTPFHFLGVSAFVARPNASTGLRQIVVLRGKGREQGKGIFLDCRRQADLRHESQTRSDLLPEHEFLVPSFASHKREETWLDNETDDASLSGQTYAEKTQKHGSFLLEIENK